MRPPAILVLAGRRSAVPDPLAAAAGVSHKCLVPVAGQAMLGRVLETSAAAWPDAHLFVSIEDFDAVASEPTVARLHAAGRLSPITAQSTIADSVVEAARASGFPLVVTTADNVLLTADALHALAAQGAKREADAIVVVARREDIRAAHPDGQRRFYEFKDVAISNCNLFWLGNDRALKAAETFRGGGQFAKHPGRIVKAFGVANLIAFRFRLATLDGLCRRISRRFGVRIRPMLVDDGRLAIDVDNERTHRVAEEILARNQAPGTVAAA
ncbi:NTP transferase domain-containing protein [Sphingosinicella sp. LY1275]|uniref:NTP transferase domain-containing protein n=1 Tax=Sphingosinicella sp. LY1275 TaxID=3095379 RepID=UPI002ADEE331|nr:NTP transferase domain-containing protein [Sphingosinicella sp. LY1275]MEA1015773.1 NTP transferase domain-containing protein [Sphingosinicella sp. LY1275]